MSSVISRIGIGIDTARYGHHVSFLDEKKQTASSAFNFKEDSEGYEKLLSALKKLRNRHPGVKLYVRIDSAGQYADNLIHWLHQQDLSLLISVGTTKKNKAYREAHFDKRKADPVDSLACARFAAIEMPDAMFAPEPAFGSLRNVAAALEANSTNLTRLVNQLHILLSICFPEFAVCIKNISSGHALKILEKYPTAKRLSSARIDSLLSIPHLTDETAHKLHQSAKKTTAHANSTIEEVLIKAKVAEIKAAKTQSATLLKLLQKAWKALPEGPHRRVHSIKGIGIQTAAAIVAKMVSIERFQCDSAVIGYFGIFPEEKNTSGTDRDGNPKVGKTFGMSVKGNDLVRRLLYLAAQSASKHNPAVRALFARQVAQGKHYDKIMGHCMAKLLRQVFAVWSKDEDFDPEFEAKQAEKEKEKVVGLKVDEPPSEEVTATKVSLNAPAPVRKPPLDLKAMKNQIQILDVLHSHHWKQATAKGLQLRGPCPIHQGEPTERTFAVHTQKNAFCCHRCNAKGNALDLIEQLYKQPLLEAVWTWIEQAGIEPVLLPQTKRESL